uniref:Uncharacterized protein n=1 Tax=Timema poppense TaxID=170557 RepID=A0A7R9DP95_TIMPO|nr:unnamed protein product [Timema poppensis]
MALFKNEDGAGFKLDKPVTDRLPYCGFTRSPKSKRRTETWSRDANHKMSASSARAVPLKFNSCLLLPLCSRCSVQENQSNFTHQCACAVEIERADSFVNITCVDDQLLQCTIGQLKVCELSRRFWSLFRAWMEIHLHLSGKSQRAREGEKTSPQCSED